MKFKLVIKMNNGDVFECEIIQPTVRDIKDFLENVFANAATWSIDDSFIINVDNISSISYNNK